MDQDAERAASAAINSALQVHRAVGPGMLESTYEAMLAYELMEQGHAVQRQKYIDLNY